MGQTGPGRLLRTAIAVALALIVSGCAPRLARPNLPEPVRGSVRLYDKNVTVLMSAVEPQAAQGPLLLYATGDGGWRSLDRTIFAQLSEWGYPVAGINSGAYLKSLGYSGETTPVRLAKDFLRIIDYARTSMKLAPDTPVVLVGLSRGSGLHVVAGSNPMLRRQLQGIVALALTKEEEHVKRSRRRRGVIPPGTPKRELVVIDTYEQLQQLAIPIEVIQSTRDHYLSAADARERFGPDTGSRRLVAVDARNHGFRSAHDAVLTQLRSALSWIGELQAARAAARGPSAPASTRTMPR